MSSGLLPSNTYTFLFTDIEGSSKLWDNHPESMRTSLARHDTLVREAIAAANGTVFKTIGDAFCAVFSNASDALAASVAAQRSLAAEPWPQETPIRVRMAVHSGAAESRDNDFFGAPLNRAARLLSIGHGGQVLLSQATAELTRDALPRDIHLRELGEHRLRDLGRPETVYQLLHPDLAADFAPLRSLTNPGLKHNLPQQVTSFIGREKELAEVASLLAKSRVLTLTGAGGSGKTRLSLQVAADLLDEYVDGVWLVELASLADGSMAAQAVATVLGVREEQGKPIIQTVTQDLQSKRALILLDNCEHVLDASARIADSLVRGCPGVQIIASSREALGIAGEQTYRVPSLTRPDPKKARTLASLAQYESVQLFVERAQMAQADFRLTDTDAPALASLCFHLDGIPLALELAAARVRSLSVGEIEGKLGQRFRLLTGGSRTALPRQQTLRALVSWSYDLLNEMEREAFEQLSVFAGGWTLELAEEVCGDPIDSFEVLDLLTALVEKSLVNFERGQEGRYDCYESIREFAAERLADRPEAEAAARRRHAEVTASDSIRWVRLLRTTEEPEALAHLERNYANVTAALSWSQAAGDTDLVARLALALAAFDQRRGYPRDGMSWLRDTTTDGSVAIDPEIQVRLLCERASLHLDLMENEEAQAPAEEALRLSSELGHSDLMIRSENLLGQVAMALLDYQSTRLHYRRALELSEKAQNWVEVARLQNNLGILERRAPDGSNETAAEHYRAALEIQRRHRHRRGEAETLNSLGVLEQSRDNLELAAEHYEQAALIELELDHAFGVAKTLSNYGEVLAMLGQHGRAVAALSIAEQIFARIKSPYQAYTVELLQASADQLGQTEAEIEALRAEAAELTLAEAVAKSLQGSPNVV